MCKLENNAKFKEHEIQAETSIHNPFVSITSDKNSVFTAEIGGTFYCAKEKIRKNDHIYYRVNLTDFQIEK
jgi:hypothetical protein